MMTMCKTMSQFASYWMIYTVVYMKSFISSTAPMFKYTQTTHEHNLRIVQYIDVIYTCNTHTMPFISTSWIITQYLYRIIFWIDPQHTCCCIWHSINTTICTKYTTIPTKYNGSEQKRNNHKKQRNEEML